MPMTETVDMKCLICHHKWSIEVDVEIVDGEEVINITEDLCPECGAQGEPECHE